MTSSFDKLQKISDCNFMVWIKDIDKLN
ncbi:uncharacterized protein METZ01_LOCUS336594 [marine metagenome]|uniref:Uncharacterized protein n=1 Tax=marine metagenome TaxID=408172 RepID=A0A382QFJ2_9ZZZZ